jgi:hypothetical protein
MLRRDPFDFMCRARRTEAEAGMGGMEELIVWS